MPPAARALVVFASFKVVLAMASIAFWSSLPRPEPATVPMPTSLLQTLLYSVAAALLLYGGRTDLRARFLGAFFLLLAAAYADRLGRQLLQALALEKTALGFCQAIQLDGFEPWLFWCFTLRFPRTAAAGPADRVAGSLSKISAVIGGGLFSTQLLLAFWFAGWADSAGLPALNAHFGRRSPDSMYWPIIFVLFAPAVPILLWRARDAAEREKAKVRRFARALIIGMAPLTLNVLLTAFVPGYRRMIRETAFGALLLGAVIVLLSSIPLTTAYAVMVERTLDVRLVIRRVVQYALARHALTAGVSLPLVAIAAYLFRNREQTVGSLLTGTRVLFLVAASATAAVLLSFRGRILDALDRRFFRERYDARTILAGLARESRRVTRPGEFAALVEVEVERALHPLSVAVLVVDPDSGQLTSSGGALPTLAPESLLAELARTRAEPFDVDLETPPLSTLPDSERRWLADLGVTLVVPLTASEGRLVGLIAMGPRKSELPYSREDRQLLADVAASGAIVVENRLIRAERRMPSRSEPRGVSSSLAADGADLTPERWAQLKEMLAEALELAPSQRASFVQRLEAQDPTAARELDSLIASYQDSETLLDTSPILQPAALSPKALLGPYEIEALIGSGGMGRVYRARDTRLGRDVALKVLSAELEDSPRARRRFEREVRAVASLSHPNILAIHDYGRAGAVDYAVMELLEGETLRAQLDRGALPLTRVLDQARQIARGLVAAHAKGIVHRDLKPENLFRTVDGVVKILDFGLAKRTLPSSGSAASAVSRPGMLLGTVGYMSPEQVRSEQVDARSDLFSLGSVSYEMLTGRRAFERATAVETMAAILKEEPAALDTSQAPQALSVVVHRCLDKDPARRFASAAELLRALESIELPGAA